MDLTHTYLMIVLGLFPITILLIGAFYVLNDKSLEGKMPTILFRTLGLICLFVSVLVVATLSELALYNRGVIY